MAEVQQVELIDPNTVTRVLGAIGFTRSPEHFGDLTHSQSAGNAIVVGVDDRIQEPSDYDHFDGQDHSHCYSADHLKVSLSAPGVYLWAWTAKALMPVDGGYIRVDRFYIAPVGKRETDIKVKFRESSLSFRGKLSHGVDLRYGFSEARYTLIKAFPDMRPTYFCSRFQTNGADYDPKSAMPCPPDVEKLFPDGWDRK